MDTDMGCAHDTAQTRRWEKNLENGMLMHYAADLLKTRVSCFVMLSLFHNFKDAIQQVEVEYVPEKQNYMVILMRSSGRSLRKFSFKGPVESEENDKRMRLLLVQPQKRRLTLILKRKSRMPNRKIKASQIRRKRFDFQYPVYYVALQRRMKIAELKQISTKPDVVEVRIVGKLSKLS
ncbi:hypothetical protein RHGRI_001655 [Rhododendron griersonianum]|uniref:Uncharacterized protein n=1 Tax=Rhododendron griersonianum TaxID=479676 RepID=A0AAV6LLU0_9ERIC|nr:hypothetical protein RHGRI_001655 [Rhododendron griersonianum]